LCQTLKNRAKQFYRKARTEGIISAFRAVLRYILYKVSPIKILPWGFISAVDVLFIVGCEGQSQRYRVDNIAAGLREMGFNAVIVKRYQICLLNLRLPPKVVVVFRYDDCDRGLTSILLNLKRRDVTLVADYDDLVFELDIIQQIEMYRCLPAWGQENYRQGVRGYLQVLAQCDKGTASTPYLARSMEKFIGKTAVIPNTLNGEQMNLANIICAQAQIKRNKGCLMILYASGTYTHQTDFEQCAQALAKFMGQRPEARFLLVGLLDLPQCFADLQNRIERKPILPYQQLLAVTAEADINLAPLEKTSFNDAKSELKIFEAGVVRVPTIASPSDSYARFIENGVDGFLAETEGDWYRALCILADDPELRKSMGEKARAKALVKCDYRDAAVMAADFYGLNVGRRQ
jgi:glycosyltransferase involved in cell wall biosynthesis